jgi:hypothetical protein
LEGAALLGRQGRLGGAHREVDPERDGDAAPDRDLQVLHRGDPIRPHLPRIEGGPDARAVLEADVHVAPARFVGSPGTVHAGLALFIAAMGVDELIVRSAPHDHAARVVIQPTRAAWDHARS